MCSPFMHEAELSARQRLTGSPDLSLTGVRESVLPGEVLQVSGLLGLVSDEQPRW